MTNKSFTHFDEAGKPAMVDINKKAETKRIAIASCIVSMQANTLNEILSHRIKKGDVFQVANIAGIMAAKKTEEIIPLCHSLPLSYIKIDFKPDLENSCVKIQSEASVISKTGVEMEALTAVSVSALTIYDMCKSLDKSMSISEIKLIHKSGGKSGVYNATK